MPYIIKGDLERLIYPEIIDAITRDNSDVLDAAIATGISEAKSYLMRFDLLALFGIGDTDATVTDENLKSKTIDLVCWQLIKLANPNIDVKMFRTNYEDAIEFFNNVKKSQLAPDGWPYKKDDPDTGFNESQMIGATYNKKRNNYFR